MTDTCWFVIFFGFRPVLLSPFLCFIVHHQRQRQNHQFSQTLSYFFFNSLDVDIFWVESCDFNSFYLFDFWKTSPYFPTCQDNQHFISMAHLDFPIQLKYLTQPLASRKTSTVNLPLVHNSDTEDD